MAMLNNVTGFWDRFSFTGNVDKIRKALLDYFKREGVKCEIKDGSVVFEFDDYVYEANFVIHDNYAECVIVFEIIDKVYEDLELDVKTFIADKVNTELENHAIVYAFNDTLKVCSKFYFTSKGMMLNLFVKHFDELNQSISLAVDIIKDKIEANSASEAEQPKQIGFSIQDGNVEADCSVAATGRQ